ncbi:MAG: hypothetical protein ACXV8P_11515 [Methylobacter sp.]
MVRPANPQGKRTVALLDSLQQAKKQLQVSAKNIQQISSELFTSLFILNSQIRFKRLVIDSNTKNPALGRL